MSAAVFAAAPQEQTNPKPNILFILSDDMGYGDLSCYGSTTIATPNIDRIAAGGVRFTNGYVSGAVCAPSRAGLLTGRYQQRFGFEDNLNPPVQLKEEFRGIPLDEKLMSERLQALGYHTGAVGKWHVGESVPGHHPNARGFDFYFGMLGGGHNYFPQPGKHKLQRNGEAVTEIRTPYLTDWFTLEATDFIASDHEKKPWFLYLAFNTPHTPMQATEDDLAATNHLRGFTGVPAAKRRTYAAMQRNLDRNVGKLLALLAERGELDNTLVVFLNDNGGTPPTNGGCNAPLRGMKGSFLEGGIRVPFLMMWPGSIPVAQTYEQPVISLDLMATFLAAAGGEMPVEVLNKKKGTKRIYDGVDLLPFVNHEVQSAPHERLFWRSGFRSRAVREGKWKLIITPLLGASLYDLEADISELNNVAGKHPELVVRLRRELFDWETSFERNPLWLTGVRWRVHSAKHHEREYQLTQP
jgi:arylsulfatase B